jgi:hypothetical protein
MFFSANDTSAYPNDMLYIHYTVSARLYWLNVTFIVCCQLKNPLMKDGTNFKKNKQGITLQIDSKIGKSNMLAQGLAR